MLVWSLFIACGREPAPTPSAAGATAATGAAPAGACVGSDPATWGSCTGQTVTLNVTRPKMIPNAPILAGPDRQQDYFEVGGTSLIALVKEPVGCDNVALMGTLRVVDLGGPKGTPEEWRGWVIDVASVTCE